MKISVTQQHIDRGEPCDPDHCPLALAFLDAGFDVSVVVDTIALYNEELDHVADLPLPKSAIGFRRRFDDHKCVKPFEFEMPGLSKNSAFPIPCSAFQPVPVTS